MLKTVLYLNATANVDTDANANNDAEMPMLRFLNGPSLTNTEVDPNVSV